jgi:PAS domain S-box-containing protein
VRRYFGELGATALARMRGTAHRRRRPAPPSAPSEHSADTASADDGHNLQQLLNVSPVGLALIDRDLRYLYVNDAMAAMNGVPAAAHVGRTPMELWPGVPAENYVPHVRAVLDGTAETRHARVAGESPAEPGRQRHWDEIFYAVRAPAGEVTAVGLMAMDVTERWAAESALRRSEATLRLILDSAPNGVLLVDDGGRIAGANRECARLFGYTAEEMFGQTVEMLLPERLRPGHIVQRLEYAEEPVTRRMGHNRDLRGRRKDGSEFPVEVGLAVTEGAPGLVTCVVTDISERKRVERERAALLEAERAASDRLVRLQGVTEAGLAQLPLPELLRELLERVAAAVSADAAAMFLPDESGTHLTLRASIGVNEGDMTRRLRVGTGIAGRVARDGRPRLDRDLAASGLVDPAQLQGLLSIVSLPLTVAGRVCGVLQIASREEDRFSEPEIDVLQPFADRVALAVDRARSFERERDIAETLQRSLLPAQLPRLAGASIAARYLPGAAGMQVGGDWYDALDTGDNGVVLVLGDVMGRGVRAASVMGQLRAAVRIYVGMGLELPEVAARLNETVLGMGESEMATVVLARLFPRTGELEWLSAGHLPAAVRRPDGTAYLKEFPNGGGIALGALEGATYSVARTVLPPGSSLLLYTDGLVERPDSTLDDGLERLLEAVASSPGEPDALCDSVVDRFFPTGSSEDDVALLVVHLHEVAVAPLQLTLPPDLEAVPSTRARLRTWLLEAGATEDEALDVLLAVGEALTRTSGGDGATPRTVSVGLFDHNVEVLIKGTGAPSPPEGTDRGRGLVLMESVVNELSITHENAGDTEQLRLVRRLSAPAASPVD